MSKFTTKHSKEFAAHVARLPKSQRKDFAEFLIPIFRSDNCRFKEHLFREACDIEEDSTEEK
jgi:hypothetical protein